MSGAEVSYAATVAGIRTTIAAYAQAVDDGRTEDIVATFCPDGWIDLPRAGMVAGREALTALFSGQDARTPGRHVVTGTHVTKWSADYAEAVSDLMVVGQANGPGWGVQLVARYFDVLHHHDGNWRFQARTLRSLH
jgi:hypothetical protein